MSSTDTATPRPLTADDFEPGTTATDLPMTSGDNGDWYGYGHIAPDAFAAAANACSWDLGCFQPGDEDMYTADDVRHRWAVTTTDPDVCDGEWGFEWVKAGTPGAWPVTHIAG